MSTTTPKVTVAVQVEHEDVVWLTEQASKEKMSRSSLIRQALNWYRNEREAIAYMVAESDDRA